MDAVDVEELNDMVASRSYARIEGRIKLVASQKLAELVQPHSEVETATIRGYIQGLELAMNVPKILKSEATKGEYRG